MSKLRPEYKGLRRIARGAKHRRLLIDDQLGQADDLVRSLKAELLELLEKRARAATRRLDLMDELGMWRGRDGMGEALLPVHLVEEKLAGRVAMRELLQQLAAPQSFADEDPSPKLGVSRPDLKQRVKAARVWRDNLDDDMFFGDDSSDSSSSSSSDEWDSDAESHGAATRRVVNRLRERLCAAPRITSEGETRTRTKIETRRGIHERKSSLDGAAPGEPSGRVSP